MMKLRLFIQWTKKGKVHNHKHKHNTYILVSSNSCPKETIFAFITMQMKGCILLFESSLKSQNKALGNSVRIWSTSVAWLSYCNRIYMITTQHMGNMSSIYAFTIDTVLISSQMFDILAGSSKLEDMWCINSQYIYFLLAGVSDDS